MTIQQVLLTVCIALLTGCIYYIQSKYDAINAKHEKQIKALAKQQHITLKLLSQLIRDNNEQKRDIEQLKKTVRNEQLQDK